MRLEAGSINKKYRQPRLLIILNRFVIGGQAVDTLPLAYYLKDEFKVLILYGRREKDEIEPDFLLEKYQGLNLKKIRFLQRSINPIIDVLAFIELLITIIKYHPTIVHTHGAKTGLLGRLAAFFCRVPVIVHTYHGHFFHSYFSKTTSLLIAWVEKGMAKITTAIVALSQNQKRDLVDIYKVTSKQKVYIIPLGFDPKFECNRDYRKEFREKYGLDNTVVAIGIVGRIVPVKNHQLFLKVIERLLSRNSTAQLAFFIIGDGELRTSLEHYLHQKSKNFSTDKYSPDKKIVFTSWIKSMEHVMNGLDILALTSLNEGTPLTLIEAQYFKKPVVATNVGGVKDTMEDEKTGFLIPLNNLDVFMKKLELLINDTSLRQKMGEAGRQFVINKFSKQNEVNLLRELYLSLLGKIK